MEMLETCLHMILYIFNTACFSLPLGRQKRQRSILYYQKSSKSTIFSVVKRHWESSGLPKSSSSLDPWKIAPCETLSNTSNIMGYCCAGKIFKRNQIHSFILFFCIFYKQYKLYYFTSCFFRFYIELQSSGRLCSFLAIY